MESTAARKTISRPAGAPLHGTVAVPGDSSIGCRALMLAALAIGETRISGVPRSPDMTRAAAAMRALGAEVARDADGAWRVAGRGIGALTEPGGVLDMGNAATAAWLLCGILASHPIFATMTGDRGLLRRPMRRLTDPLSACGARFAMRQGGYLPLAVQGAADALPPDYRAPAPSALVKSALLLAGLNARGTTRIEEPAATDDSAENLLRHFGASVRIDIAGAGRAIALQGQPELRAANVVAPGDPALAAFPLVAALLTPGSSLTMPGIGLSPPRTGLFATLAEMGGNIAIHNRRVENGEPMGDLVATHGALRAVEVSAERAAGMTDDYPILAVAAAGAVGAMRLPGFRARDRLDATAALLAVNGIKVEIEGDDLIVHGAEGPPPGGGRVETYMDHRIAMAALVLGMVSEQPVTVDDARSIGAHFPEFAALMNAVGASLSIL